MSRRGSNDDVWLRELVGRAKSGSPEARAHLIAHYYHPLRAYIRQRINDPTYADDLAHDTLLYVLDHLHQLDNDASFPFWLNRIARSMVAKEWRRPEHTRTVPLDAANEASAPSPSLTDTLVRDVLSEPSLGLREALEEYGLHGEEITVVARRANRSVTAVRKNFKRAKDRFKVLYNKEQEDENNRDSNYNKPVP